MINSKGRIIKKLGKIIKIESFLKEILNNINSSLYNVNVKISTKLNSLIIKFDDNMIVVKIYRNKIIYLEEIGNRIVKKEYNEIEQGYTVKKETITKEIFGPNNKNEMYIGEENINEFRFYDKNQKEIYRGIKTKNENYYKNMITDEIRLCDPSFFKNYIEKQYYYRIEDKYILTRTIRTYDPSIEKLGIENSDNVCIKYETIDPNVKDIQTGGRYFGIDSDVFFKYNQKEATMEDILDNFHSKKYRIPHDNFI